MKIDKNYDYIVLDAMLYYPADGKPDSSDSLALLTKMLELKLAYPNSRCILVFDGGEQVDEWRDRQSNAAFCNGWISYYIEEEAASRCIHSLVSLANAEQASALIFSSTIEDLKWISDRIEFVMVDEDGDLCRHWTLDRFVDVFGLEPESLALVKALSGWNDYKPLVPESQIQSIVHRFRAGLPLAYGKVDLSAEIEERLRLLDGKEPSSVDLRLIRRAFSKSEKVENSGRDG